MEVHHQEHVEARDQEILERVKRAVLEGEVALAVLHVEGEIRGQPVEIELPVAHAGIKAVATEIIHPIRVELARDELVEQRAKIHRLRRTARLRLDRTARLRLAAELGDEVRGLRGRQLELRIDQRRDVNRLEAMLACPRVREAAVRPESRMIFRV